MHEYDPTTGRFIDTSIVAKRAANDKARRDQREAEYQETQRRAAAAQAQGAQIDAAMAGRAAALDPIVLAAITKSPSAARGFGIDPALARWCYNRVADAALKQTAERDARFAASVKAGQL